MLAYKPVKFTKYNRSMRVPFVIYTDIESFNKKIDTCEPNSEQSYMQKIMKQVPSSFCFYLVSTVTGASGGVHAANGEKFEPVTYTASGDEDVAEIFVEKLTEYSKMIYNKYAKYSKDKTNFARQQYVTSVNNHSHLKNFSPTRRTGTRSGIIVI
jgi:hypothetical protein